jgi:hypothetical protein
MLLPAFAEAVHPFPVLRKLAIRKKVAMRYQLRHIGDWFLMQVEWFGIGYGGVTNEDVRRHWVAYKFKWSR